VCDPTEGGSESGQGTSVEYEITDGHYLSPGCNQMKEHYLEEDQ